jgi:hypothetical protein
MERPLLISNSRSINSARVGFIVVYDDQYCVIVRISLMPGEISRLWAADHFGFEQCPKTVVLGIFGGNQRSQNKAFRIMEIHDLGLTLKLSLPSGSNRDIFI